MFLESGNIRECSGCYACYSVCGHKAIEMKADENGFIIPVKIKDRCVDCGLCEKVCPIVHPAYPNAAQPSAFAAYDPKERKKSSSGGLFYTIARRVINNNGVVFGAAFDSEMHLRHIGVKTIEGLRQLRGSKYVQSHIEEVFREVRRFLKENRQVYFVGTPCQVAGLKAFLMRDYENLLTSDLVCHGVPSQQLFEKHIRLLSEQENSRVNGYSFRDTRYWVTREEVSFENGHTAVKYDGNTSPYLYAFGRGYSFRDCCFDCKFAHIPRQGDITLADYWGVGRYHPEVDDRGGVSMVLINSEKGERIWKDIRGCLKYRESDVESCKRYNPNLVRPTAEPEERRHFLTMLKSKPYAAVAEEMLQCPPQMRNRAIERAMKLRRFGLIQPLDALKVLVKKTVAVLNINKVAYEMYGKLRNIGK